MKNVAHLKPYQFQKGTSGNFKGRPRKFLNRIEEKCHANGKHPYDEIMKLLPQLRPREQVDVWLQILSYCEAKPKSADEPKDEQTAIRGELARLSTKELIDLVRDNLGEVI